jgi:hypothetical protein
LRPRKVPSTDSDELCVFEVAFKPVKSAQRHIPDCADSARRIQFLIRNKIEVAPLLPTDAKLLDVVWFLSWTFPKTDHDLVYLVKFERIPECIVNFVCDGRARRIHQSPFGKKAWPIASDLKFPPRHCRYQPPFGAA